MNFQIFEPVYEAILSDFGFDRAADERARDVAADIATPFPDRLGDWRGETVAIAGAAPCLSDEVEIARNADVVVAASTAADALRDRGVDVDCMVTDLDKNPETAAALTHEGVPVAAHAHGDNIPAVREWLPGSPTRRRWRRRRRPPLPDPKSWRVHRRRPRRFPRTTSALVASCSRGGTSTTRTWTR